jgi:cytochrome b561
MSGMNTKKTYGAVAKSLHWTIFILVLIMIIGGFCLGYVPKEYKNVIYNLHKLTGLIILALMMVRLVWALINVKPALPAPTPAWQCYAERVVHGLLYLIIIAMPVAGWIGSSAARKGPHIGNINLNLPVPESKAVTEAAFEMHELIAFAIIFLVSLHVAAALYHHFVKRDAILLRMLP